MNQLTNNPMVLLEIPVSIFEPFESNKPTEQEVYRGLWISMQTLAVYKMYFNHVIAWKLEKKSFK